MRASESIRLCSLAGMNPENGKGFVFGQREAALIEADRDREFSDTKIGGEQPACESTFSVEIARTLPRPGDQSAMNALGTIRGDSFSGRFAASFLRRIGPPNKTPEPTTTSVMPRAIADSILIARLAGARVTPAVVVAHL